MLLLGRKEVWKEGKKEKERFNFSRQKRISKQIINNDSCLSQVYTKVMRVLSGIFV